MAVAADRTALVHVTHSVTLFTAVNGISWVLAVSHWNTAQPTLDQVHTHGTNVINSVNCDWGGGGGNGAGEGEIEGEREGEI